jgi:hypothetical protein
MSATRLVCCGGVALRPKRCKIRALLALHAENLRAGLGQRTGASCRASSSAMPQHPPWISVSESVPGLQGGQDGWVNAGQVTRVLHAAHLGPHLPWISESVFKAVRTARQRWLIQGQDYLAALAQSRSGRLGSVGSFKVRTVLAFKAWPLQGSRAHSPVNHRCGRRRNGSDRKPEPCHCVATVPVRRCGRMAPIASHCVSVATVRRWHVLVCPSHSMHRTEHRGVISPFSALRHCACRRSGFHDACAGSLRIRPSLSS